MLSDFSRFLRAEVVNFGHNVSTRIAQSMSMEHPCPSVILRLMGVDDFPVQQPVVKRARVLSEGYLQKVASIGMRKKSAERYSLYVPTDEEKERDSWFMSFSRKRVATSASFQKMQFTGQKVVGPVWESPDDERFLNSKERREDPLKVVGGRQRLSRYCRAQGFSAREILRSKGIRASKSSQEQTNGANSWLEHKELRTPLPRNVCIKTSRGKTLTGVSKHAVRSSRFSKQRWNKSAKVQQAAPDTNSLYQNVVDVPLNKAASVKEFTSSHHSFSENRHRSPDSVLLPLGQEEMSEAQSDLDQSEMSEVYSEGSCIVSSDDDNDKESVSNKDENESVVGMLRAKESRNFSYLVDLITDAGLNKRETLVNPDSCVISSCVFETLEKKYGEQITWKRSERMLLFDRINLVLQEMLQQSMGIREWTRSVTSRLMPGQVEEAIEDELWMILACQERVATADSEMILDKDDKWMDLVEEIRAIGREIEHYLIDELVEEVIRVNVESF